MSELYHSQDYYRQSTASALTDLFNLHLRASKSDNQVLIQKIDNIAFSIIESDQNLRLFLKRKVVPFTKM